MAPAYYIFGDHEHIPLLQNENAIPHSQEDQLMTNASGPSTTLSATADWVTDMDLDMQLRELEMENEAPTRTYSTISQPIRAASLLPSEMLGVMVGEGLQYLTNIPEFDQQDEDGEFEEEDEDEDMDWGPNLLKQIFEKAQDFAKRTSAPLRRRSHNASEAPPTPPLSPSPSFRELRVPKRSASSKSSSTSKEPSTPKPSSARLPLTPILSRARFSSSRLPRAEPRRVLQPANIRYKKDSIYLPNANPNLKESRYSSLQHWKVLSQRYSGKWHTHSNRKAFTRDNYFKHPNLMPDHLRLEYSTWHHFHRRHRLLLPEDRQRKVWGKAKIAAFRKSKLGRMDVDRPGMEWTFTECYEPSPLRHVELSTPEDKEVEVEWDEVLDGTSSETSEEHGGSEESEVDEVWDDDLDLLGYADQKYLEETFKRL